MTTVRSFLVGLAMLFGLPAQTHAHALDPGFLEITQIEGETFRIFWRKPDVQGNPMAIDARLPGNCDQPSGPEVARDGRAWSTTWIATCSAGLAGTTVNIDGLEATQTDVLLRVSLVNAPTASVRLTPNRSEAIIPDAPGPWNVLKTYFPLGVEHILGGGDHLLFVFALLLLIPDAWRLVGAITAFTIAHSITMGAATLGYVTLPGPPVEAIIALSIMFVASELLRRRRGDMLLSERYPWIVSFSFGLLHGFGFAGALEEIGLPQGEVPLALLAFNLGVEAGQLLFVGAVLISGWVLARAFPKLIEGLRTPGRAPATVAAYAIGGMSAYWLIDRLSGFH